MKQYFLYFFTGFTSLCCVILAFQTLQTGILLTNTLFGSIGIFMIAAIVSLFNQKFGAGIGIVCLFLITPWLSRLPIGVIFETSSFQAVALLTLIPILLVAYSGYYSIKNVILNKDLSWNLDNKIKPFYKYTALAIHVILIVLWVFSLFNAQTILSLHP